MSQNQTNNLFPIVAGLTAFFGFTMFELGWYFGRKEILNQNTTTTTTTTTFTLTERLIYPDGSVTYKPVRSDRIIIGSNANVFVGY